MSMLPFAVTLALTVIFALSAAWTATDLVSPTLTISARMDAVVQTFMNLTMVAMLWERLWLAIAGDWLVWLFVASTAWIIIRIRSMHGESHRWHGWMHAAMMLVMIWMSWAMEPARMTPAMAAMAQDMAGMEEGMRMTMTTGVNGVLGVAATSLMLLTAAGCLVRILDRTAQPSDQSPTILSRRTADEAVGFFGCTGMAVMCLAMIA